jgi:hypothetical protein
MARWNIFLGMHTHDQFWANHQPAFHAYDHGANIPIQVNEAMEALPRETTLRADEYESESESESGSGSGSETESVGDEGEGNNGAVPDEAEEAPLFARERGEDTGESASEARSTPLSGRQPSEEPRGREEERMQVESPETEDAQRPLLRQPTTLTAFSETGSVSPYPPIAISLVSLLPVAMLFLVNPICGVTIWLLFLK